MKMMKKSKGGRRPGMIGGLVLLCLICLLSSCRRETSFSLMQFNIWQEGTSVPGGFEAVADEIARTDADFVTLSEVRNYRSSRFCDRIVEALSKRGKVYYSFYSEDSGILSRHPIREHATVFPLNNDQGSIYRIVTEKDGQEIAVYTAHLDYRNCALYLPRGYDGSTWKKLPAPVTDLEKILDNNRASRRDDAVRAFLQAAQKDREAGRLVLLGGDFNEPSHLDWTEKTRNMRDHHGMIVPWDCTVMLEKEGFIDCYRAKYPDPVTHPGFTYPADCRDARLERLAWSPDADDRDRIDYIFYADYPGLSVEDARIIGPRGDVCRNRRVNGNERESVTEPLGVWPTDHKAVLVSFLLIR